MGTVTKSLPRYSSKYSKRTYTQPQLAIALSLMKRDGNSRRSMTGASKEVGGIVGLAVPPYVSPFFVFLRRFKVTSLDLQ
jgi:hypothetical protein